MFGGACPRRGVVDRARCAGAGLLHAELSGGPCGRDGHVPAESARRKGRLGSRHRDAAARADDEGRCGNLERDGGPADSGDLQLRVPDRRRDGDRPAQPEREGVDSVEQHGGDFRQRRLRGRRAARDGAPAHLQVTGDRQSARRRRLHSARLRSDGLEDLPGALPAPRVRRQPARVDGRRQGQRDRRQPHRRGQGRAARDRDAVRPWRAAGAGGRRHAGARPEQRAVLQGRRNRSDAARRAAPITSAGRRNCVRSRGCRWAAGRR